MTIVAVTPSPLPDRRHGAHGGPTRRHVRGPLGSVRGAALAAGRWPGAAGGLSGRSAGADEPSRDHERIKSFLGCLLEAYALEAGIDLSPSGAWTLKHAPRKAGAEPDECYIVGPDQDKDAPDLVIEVAWTSGGIDKLEIYRRRGVALEGGASRDPRP